MYFSPDPSIDVDNMAKPILDALIGVVIDDDENVIELVVRKTRITPGLLIKDAPSELIDALSKGTDFIYVIIDNPPNEAELP